MRNARRRIHEDRPPLRGPDICHAGQADVPQIGITMLDRPDLVASPLLGAKGCGEIGKVGIAVAIINAMFNATGVRLRGLPIVPEKILEAAR